MATDPLSLLYSGIWDVLNASPALVSVVPPGNQIRYDGTSRQPEKSRGASAIELPADRPLLRLQPNGGSELLLISSSSTKIIQRYQLLLALGSLNVNQWLNPLQFIILGALTNWQKTLFALNWNGDKFVKLLTVKDVPVGRSMPDAEKGIQSWAALYNISLELWFTTLKLQNMQAGDFDIGD